ncbi:hypothetical protein CMEL01_16644 [Colletotrichum melonis]|uniref:Uncharacterized protein n=1 Tax=Colletotrichum melonis TaxID=1209925 RepID=A0AAI9UA83_9PEZI|nr:hypothetical protein CMEL01_16644 [Colletotrichum melonis]
MRIAGRLGSFLMSAVMSLAPRHLTTRRCFSCFLVFCTQLTSPIFSQPHRRSVGLSALLRLTYFLPFPLFTPVTVLSRFPACHDPSRFLSHVPCLQFELWPLTFPSFLLYQSVPTLEGICAQQRPRQAPARNVARARRASNSRCDRGRGRRAL